MNVVQADHAGFCFGVRRAVNLVESQLEQGKLVCTFGPLIHNPQVIKDFERRGVVVANSVGEIPAGYTVVIRSHGLPQKTAEEIVAKGNEIVDATCPDVKKIHEIVQQAAAKGKSILIAGDIEHPEVQGILSYCGGKYFCFLTAGDLQNYFANRLNIDTRGYILLAQTTFHQKEWDQIKKVVENAYTNVGIFDTICNATILRQKSAAELAKRSDIMVVLGGAQSSNTKKLAAICSEFCKTELIEYPEQLRQVDFGAAYNVGVTAGASTPAFIIKEVRNIMSDVFDNKEEMSFEEMLNESFKMVNAREKVTAVVTNVEPHEIAVDIGTKHAGYVPLYEYTDDPSVDLTTVVKPGDEIELMVLRLNDAEGTALLSKKRLDAIAGFDKIVEAQEADEKLTGRVVDVVKGGIIVLTNGVRVFIPASHATLNRGEDLNALKGTEVEYKILEVNKSRRRAVGSVRDILKEERKEAAEKFWQDVEVGKTMKGVVKSLTNYGAFVDLGGVDGMVHISELSWSRIKHPSDVLSLGQEIDVLIKDVDRENHKISLGYKQDDNNPWKILERDYKVGDVVDAKIVSMTPFGAFAQIIPGVDGLIHISQISTERVAKPSDVLSIGQEVQVKITDIDFDRKRVSLSMCALMEDQEQKDEEQQIAEGNEAVIVAQAGPDEVVAEIDVTDEDSADE